jgi:hypothetical protein
VGAISGLNVLRIINEPTAAAIAYGLDDFMERHCSLHEVVQYFDKPEDRSKFRLVCDCPYFWSSNSHCAHVVAIYHELGVISIFDMMSHLAPVRKRGRPTTRDLEHDRDLEDDGVKKVKPSAWLKQSIRHPEHLTGMVYDTRTYEKYGQRVTVWNVPWKSSRL